MQLKDLNLFIHPFSRELRAARWRLVWSLQYLVGPEGWADEIWDGQQREIPQSKQCWIFASVQNCFT